ncbi:MAG: hypothetical protein ACXV8O_01435 [Methylobacter sp.]
MAEIIQLHPEEPALNPDTVLEKAIGDFDSVVVIGRNKDGSIGARASLNIGQAEIHWMLSVFQHKLLNGDYSAED